MANDWKLRNTSLRESISDTLFMTYLFFSSMPSDFNNPLAYLGGWHQINLGSNVEYSVD